MLAPRDLDVGARLGSCRIVRVLGRGGMGAVLEAVDESAAQRRVAVKVISHELARDPSVRARFRREAQAAAAVRHDACAVIHGSGEHEGTPYLVFELLEGGSLADRLKRGGRLPWREAALLGARIASALAAIHAAGIVHRDLKPANILFDAEGRAKLGDFGLVRGSGASDLGASGRLTATGEVVGTLAYMAPEQAKAGPIDGRADLYALGATLYECVTGRTCFEGTGWALAMKHIAEAPRPPRELAPEVPAELEAVILRLLAKDPVARGDAATVADELAAIAAVRAAPARVSGPAKALVAVALLAVLGAGALVATRRPAPPAPGSPPPPPSSLPSPRPLPSPVPKAGPDASAPVLPAEWTRLFEGKRTSLRAVFGTLVTTHANRIFGVAFVPEKRYVLSASEDRTVKVWALDTAAEVHSFGPAKTRFVSVVAQAGGKVAYAAEDSGVLHILDLDSMTEKDPIDTLHGRFGRLAITPHGETVATTGSDGCVRLWRTGDFGKRWALQAHRAIDAHPDAFALCAAFVCGDRVVSSGTDGKTRFFDVRTGQPRGEIAELTTACWTLTASRDGTRLLAGQREGSDLRLFDVSSPTARLLRTYPAGGSIYASGFAADEKVVVAGGSFADGVSLRGWDAESGEACPAFDSHMAIHGLAAEGHEHVLTGGFERKVRSFFLGTGRSQPDEDVPCGQQLALAGSVFALGGASGRVQMVSLATGAVVHKTPAGSSLVFHVAASADGKLVATVSADGIRLWDMESGAPRWFHALDDVWALAFSQDERSLVAASPFHPLVTLAVETGETVSEYPDLPRGGALALQHNGRNAFLGSTGGVNVVDLYASRSEPTLQTDDTMVAPIALDASEGRLVTVGDRSGVRAWRLSRDGTGLLAQVAPPGDYRALALLAGKRILLGRASGAIEIRGGDGELIESIDLAPLGDAPESFAVEPDGESFLVATARGVTLRLVAPR